MTTQQPTAAPTITLAEYAALPKHPRYELVKGVLVELMVASEEHEHTGSLVNWRMAAHVGARTLPLRSPSAHGERGLHGGHSAGRAEAVSSGDG